MSRELPQNKIEPRDLSTSLLLTPKLTSPKRRLAMRMRERVVRVGTEPKPETERLRAKFTQLQVGQLISWIGRFARRAATAKYILSELSPESVFTPKLCEEQDQNINAFILATQEYQSRINHGLQQGKR